MYSSLPRPSASTRISLLRNDLPKHQPAPVRIVASGTVAKQSLASGWRQSGKPQVPGWEGGGSSSCEGVGGGGSHPPATLLSSHKAATCCPERRSHCSSPCLWPGCLKLVTAAQMRCSVT